ncbi:MAG: efflux RND transporter periplasmic adaptor subunit [Eubacterium sp.]|nr:efflux RND transporter periplasmic adaptor subunit [Eubacterium sp.]
MEGNLPNGYMNKKRLIIIISIIAVVLIGAGVGVFFLMKNFGGKNEGNGKLVYVQKVSELTGNSLGNANRFMGKVESQEIVPIQKDDTKKVGEIFVEEGDIVGKGDELFAYDTEAMKMDLDSLKLELQSISNSIASLSASVKDFQAQRAEANEEDKKEYTAQINSTNAQIAEERYNYSVKEKEISRAEEAIKNAVVVSPMDGIIKSIKQNAAGVGEEQNQESGFINIMAAGEYRIKGIATEETITTVYKEMPVLIHSRTDETLVWHGTVSSINLEPEAQNGGGGYYDGGGETSSKYSFYVEPDNIDNLILGQHLYIEPDLGIDAPKDGLYLPSYYVMIEEDGSAFVWKKDEKDRIRKSPVTLGEYDEERDCYEIKDGLTKDDYIAFPDINVVDGNETTTNYDEVMEQMMNEEGGDGQSYPDGQIPDGMIDDGMMDDGMTDGGMGDDVYDMATPEDAE